MAVASIKEFTTYPKESDIYSASGFLITGENTIIQIILEKTFASTHLDFHSRAPRFIFFTSNFFDCLSPVLALSHCLALAFSPQSY